jgi:hypothetical protein
MAEREIPPKQYLTKKMVVSALGLTALLAGCSSVGGLNRETFQACINEAGITGPYSASSTIRNGGTTFVVRPGPNVTAAQAATADACISRTIDSPLPSQQSVAGGQEQRTVIRTDGNSTVETYTYGTPPSAATAPAVRQRTVSSRRGQCALKMTGGTGYTCANP